MLYTTKELLDDAQKRRYGVAYFNATDMHMLRAYILAAEELCSPIIIGTSEGLLEQYGGFEWMAPLLLNAAKNTKVPVSVHLDHTYHFETIMLALKNGFSSVMFDGSRLSYEENVSACAEISRIAHAMGVYTEFELGCVGGLENETGEIDKNIYTDPALAERFVQETNADFLAVAIGTVHGIYQKEPQLNLSILQQIRKVVSIPLVLHGGSGLSDSDFKNTIQGGICKINVYTDIVLAGTNAVHSSTTAPYAEIGLAAEASMKKAAMEKIKLFGSAGKA